MLTTVLVEKCILEMANWYGFLVLVPYITKFKGIGGVLPSCNLYICAGGRPWMAMKVVSLERKVALVYK